MRRRIVIIGGMGPQASLELHQRIIAGAANSGAKNNEDYPEILHASIPITDFISSGESEEGFRQLVTSLDALQFRTDDQVIIACNTVHLLLPQLESKYGLKFKSLVKATVKAAKKHGTDVVGLLASPTTIQTQLYEKPLNEIGCRALLPTGDEIDNIEKAIRLVIANDNSKEGSNLVEPIVKRMLDDGASNVILGCTELSVIFSKHNANYLIDPLTIVCKQLTDSF